LTRVGELPDDIPPGAELVLQYRVVELISMLTWNFVSWDSCALHESTTK